MSWSKWGRWGAVVMIAGCGSKLQVDTNPPGGGVSGSAGTGGTDLGISPGGAGGGGGTTQVVTEPPIPGSFGQPCIQSSTTTEATGTVGQADIVELTHCADGLTCGSDGKCGGIPDCPQASGICVVSPGQPNGGGGMQGMDCAGGSGCANNLGGGPSGFGGDGQGVALPESGVQALAADDTRVYWVEYGTRDALGNYANDGALKAYDGTTVATLSSKLAGPVALAVTSSHAYVYVDGAPLLGTTLKRQLLRVPLAGGDPELVQDGTIPLSFASTGDRAFWGVMGSVYSITSDPGAVPSVFQENAGYPISLVADSTGLYFIDQADSDQIESAPLTGGAPASLGFSVFPFFLKGDSIYGLDGPDNGAELVLDQAPKAGGSVKRTRALGAGGSGGRLSLVGDRYFWDQYQGYGDTELSVMSASFTSAPVSRVLDKVSVKRSLLWPASQWAANATAIYWTDGNAIYSRSLSDLQ